MLRTRRRHRAIPLLLACLAACLAPAHAAHAITRPSFPNEPSVEWAVEAADRVLRGTVRPGMARRTTHNGVPWLEVTLDVSETIKGPAAEQITFLAPAHLDFDKAANSWIDLLVFLQPVTPAARANAPGTDLAAWAVWNSWAFDLGRPIHPLFRTNGVLITTAEPFLAATRDAARFTAQRAAPAESWMMPEGLPPGVFQDRYERNPHKAKALLVPADARLESLAQAWLADASPSTRIAATHAIAQFHTPRNAALVRRLLEDPFYTVQVQDEWAPVPSEREWKFFPVRSAALSQLSRWNDRTATDNAALVREPHPRYAPLRWRPAALTTAALLLALACWPRRLRGPAWGTIATLASLAACAALGVLNHRAARGEDTLSFAAARANYELASTAGRLALLRVQDDAPPHAPLHRRFPTASPQPWFATMLTPRDESRRAGAYFAEGVTTGPARHPYRLIEVPHAWPIAATLAWPAAWALGRARRAARRRRWRREGRCAHCGYSLHGLTTPRCPECGAPTHALTAEVT